MVMRWADGGKVGIQQQGRQMAAGQADSGEVGRQGQGEQTVARRADVLCS
jgi:hypothetical protein